MKTLTSLLLLAWTGWMLNAQARPDSNRDTPANPTPAA
jgi:hypothetical protein